MSRVRVALEGSRGFATGAGAMVTATAELGLRHDAGDAETGTGVEVADMRMPTTATPCAAIPSSNWPWAGRRRAAAISVPNPP